MLKAWAVLAHTMRMGRQKTARFPVILTEAFRERLRRAAEWEGCTSGELTRRALASEVERVEKAQRRAAAQPDLPGGRELADAINR